jgi:SNF family Na+-dependent transporter
MNRKAENDRWGSRLGVVLAVAGSAVGLGNFLRFPGQAAQYGGGAFMIAYFIALLLIGLPICWAEWAMGRKAGYAGFHSCAGVFHYFTRGGWGKYVGTIGVVIPVVIYTYYVVIEAWCLGYAVNFLIGSLDVDTADKAAAFFAGFVGMAENGAALGLGLDRVGIYLIIAFVLNFILIYLGISRGIEIFCKYAMPTLVLLGLVLLVRVLTLGAPDPAHPHNNVKNGLGFMWNPTKVFLVKTDPGAGESSRQELIGEEAIKEAEERVAANPEGLRIEYVGVLEQLRRPQLWLAAAGQIFFSLSVGFGIVLTYASYLRQSDDVVLSGLAATSANEFCEVVLGGLITLPASVAFLGVATVAGMASTFGLGFHVLPMVFSVMPFGAFFGFLFFFLLFLAAVTSSISMLQPGIAFLEETLGIRRHRSVVLLGVVTIFGTFLVLYCSKDLKVLDTMDFWVGTFLIFILATLQILVFGWVWGVREGLQEANRGSIVQLPVSALGFAMKWISPAFLLTIFALWLLANIFGYKFGTGESQVSSYVRDLFITPNPAAWIAMAFIVVLLIASGVLIARAKAFANKENTLNSAAP